MSWIDKLRGRGKKSKKNPTSAKGNHANRSRVVTARVMMALFGGGTIEEIAQEAGVSERTVFRVIDAAKMAGFKVTRSKRGKFHAVGRSAARKRKRAGGSDAARDM